MRILSKIKNYRVTARSEKKTKGQNAAGILETHILEPELTLEFKHGALTASEVAFALAHWNAGRSRPGDMSPYAAEAWGAHPSTTAEPYDTGFETGVTIAWHPAMNLSVFDTAWLEPADREYVENWINSGGFESGGDAIVYEPPVLRAPWPAYDKIGQGAAAKIPATVRDLGLDPSYVIAYEEQNKNRDGVIAALKALLVEDHRAAVEDDVLHVKAGG